MIFDHLRRQAEKHLPGEGLCQECRSPLIAKCGEIMTWHWAHKPGERRPCSRHGETEWHLRMKKYCLDWPGWDVEVPLKIGEFQFYLDAACLKEKQIIEFVHSYSPYYTDKHAILKTSGYVVLWLADGDLVVSKRHRTSRDGLTAFDFLTDKGLILAGELERMMIFFDGVFWREGPKDCHWRPASNPLTDRLMQQIHA